MKIKFQNEIEIKKSLTKVKEEIEKILNKDFSEKEFTEENYIEMKKIESSIIQLKWIQLEGAKVKIISSDGTELN